MSEYDAYGSKRELRAGVLRLEALYDRMQNGQAPTLPELHGASDGMAEPWLYTHMGLPKPDLWYAQALFQHVVSAYFEDRAWIVACLLPGTPVIGHPASEALRFQGPLGAGAVSAQTRLVLLTSDGRHPGEAAVRVAAPDLDPEFWRSSAVAHAMLMHSAEMNPDQRSTLLLRVCEAEREMARGSVHSLREFWLRHHEVAPTDAQMADSLFGSAWDLLTVICRSPKTLVGAGTWQLPESDAREIRTRAACVQDIARLFMLPCSFSPEHLRASIARWVVCQTHLPEREMVRELTEIVDSSYWEWRNAVTSALAEGMRRFGILSSDWAVATMAARLAGGPERSLSPDAEAAAISWLLARGHGGWGGLVHLTANAERRAITVPLGAVWAGVAAAGVCLSLSWIRGRRRA